MKTQDSNLANRPVLSASNVFLYGCTYIAFSSGPYWRHLRRICITEVLISKRVKSFSSIRQEEINSMLKSFSLVSNKYPVNLSTKTYELSNSIVFRAAFGGMCKNRGLFLEIIGEVIELFSEFNLSDLFPSLSWLDVYTRRRLTRLHR
jgi:alpha-guaiene 2-oxidase